MPLKDISYLELWHSFCSAEWNHLCNFGRGYYFEFRPVSMEVMEKIPFKDFSYLYLE